MPLLEVEAAGPRSILPVNCRYCDESSEDKDMIEYPQRKIINNEVIVTYPTELGRTMSQFICLECLKGDIEANDGRWIYDM